MSESDVSAIVGSLESHLASATNQSDASGPATITLPASLNHDGARPIIQALTPASIRARANGPTLIRATGPSGGSILHLPGRQQNPIQLVTVPNSNSTVRGRGVATMLPAGATIQGATLNTASPGNVQRQVGPGTVVLGTNQVHTMIVKALMRLAIFVWFQTNKICGNIIQSLISVEPF